MTLPCVTRDQVRRFPLFSDLSDTMLDAVVVASTLAAFSRNEVIFHEHDQGTSLFIILKGKVKVSLVRPDGKEAILALLTPGEFFGEIALLDNRPRTASVIALDATEVMILTRNAFIRIIRENPQIIHNMIITLAARLRRTNKQIADLAFLDAIGRVSGVISQIATEQGEETDEGIIIRTRPSHEQLGMMAATTRETVTHCMATLERRGYVLSDGRDLIVFSIEDLRKDFLVPH